MVANGEFYARLLEAFQSRDPAELDAAFLELVGEGAGVAPLALYLADRNEPGISAVVHRGPWDDACVETLLLEATLASLQPREVQPDPSDTAAPLVLFPVATPQLDHGVLVVAGIELGSPRAETIRLMSEAYAQLTWLSSRPSADTRSLVHDLRGILAGVHGYAMLLGNHGPNDGLKLERISEIILEEIERVLQMTRTALAPRPPARGHGPPARTSIDLAELIESVARLFQARAKVARVRLRTEIDPEISLVCNPAALRRALENLTDNALKATSGSSERFVRLFCHQLENHLEIGVEDNGPGIPEKIRAQVTRTGYTTDPQQGFGLGLSLVQRIAREMAAELAIERTATGITRVFLRLPSPS